MKTYELTLTEQEMTILNDALVQLPFFKVAPLIQSINEQIKNNEEKEREVKFYFF